MFYVNAHISDITLTFDSRKIIAGLPHVHSADKPLHAQVPVDISFNEGWTVQHACGCDEGPVSFSPGHNWNFVSRLSSRHCMYIFLETMAMVFDSLRVLESTKSDVMFLTTADIDNAAAPVYEIPQVHFNHYRCEHFDREYLCRLSQGHPLPADARNHRGKAGRLLIHEIAGIGTDGDDDFQTMWRTGRGYDS